MLQTVQFPSRFDVVVVGARCAGAATAMLLAEAGLRVLAVDRQAYGSDTLSTHALMRPAVMQLSRWGLLDSVIRSGAPVIRSSTFHYGDEEVPVPIRPEPGIPGLIAPRRTVLDRVLVDAARDAGAMVLHDTTVHELTFDSHGRVRGVVVADARGHIAKVAADLVIGADGFGSFVARRVGAPTLVTGRASVAHVFGYAAAPKDLHGYHWYFGVNAAAALIPTNDGLACFVVSIPTSQFDSGFRADLVTHGQLKLATLAPELGTHGLAASVERLKAFRGAPGRLRQAYGPGWLLVGDAGFFRDPLTSHGISDALRDAEGGATAVISGSEAALRQFQEERDSMAMPILAATDDISAFDWSLANLPERHKQLSESMKAEVALLTARSQCRQQPVADLPEASLQIESIPPTPIGANL